jgi:hypothetical protein
VHWPWPLQGVEGRVEGQDWVGMVHCLRLALPLPLLLVLLLLLPVPVLATVTSRHELSSHWLSVLQLLPAGRR